MELLLATFLVSVSALVAVWWTLSAVTRIAREWRSAFYVAQREWREKKPVLVPAAARWLDSMTARHGEPSTPEEPEPVPPNVQKWISSWPDEWARDGQERRARELYQEYKDWSKVFMVLRKDVHDTYAEQNE